MNPTTETALPVPPDTGTTKPPDNRAAIKQAALAIVYYGLFQACLPLIRIPAVRLPGFVLLLLVILPTMAFMFLQVRLALSIVSLRPSNKLCCLLAVAALGVLFLDTMASPLVYSAHNHTILLALVLTQQVVHDISLTLACTFFGILLSAIIRDKNTLLPVAFIAMPIDYLGAMTPIGFTNNMLKAHPGIVKAAAVSIPKLSGPHGISLSPIALIGPGDALFMAFYFAVVVRLSLNTKETFWWMYWLLTASMLAVLVIPWFYALAALVPMGVAVILANKNRFTLTRSEWFAFLYAGIFVLCLAVGFYLFSHAKLMGGH